MKKFTMHSEVAYLLGLLFIALGASLGAHSDFGVSMIVGPAYVLHLYVSQFWPAFSFGVAEYCVQGIQLILMFLLLRKFRISYLLSFATALIYGVILDGCMWVIGLIPVALWARILCYLVGLVSSAVGVALMFRTYLTAEVYEMFVKEVSAHFKVDIHRFKTGYDCANLVIALAMSVIFFGFWPLRGVGIGTIICALINGAMIGWISRQFDKHIVFRDALPWRPFFTGDTI